MARVSPRPRLTETRRKEILAAASSIIAERGLCNARISDVAAHVGTSPSLILYYFPSKAELLAEALVYHDQLFHERVDRAVASASTAGEKLGLLVAMSCPDRNRPAESPDEWALWPAAWELSRHDDALAARRARLDEAWRARIATVVAEGIGGGEFAAVDPADFAIQLAAMLDGLAIEVMLGDATMDSERMRRLAADFVSRVLGVDLSEPVPSR